MEQSYREFGLRSDRPVMTHRVMTICLVAATVLVATMTVAVDKKGTIEELKERLKNANPKDRVELAVVITQRQIEAAEKAYNDGDVDAGQKDIGDVAEYGVMAATEAADSGKKMKHTEIDLRKVSEKLDNLARSVDLDSRPPVRDAYNKLEAARNKLLMRMFK